MKKKEVNLIFFQALVNVLPFPFCVVKLNDKKIN